MYSLFTWFARVGGPKRCVLPEMQSHRSAARQPQMQHYRKEFHVENKKKTTSAKCRTWHPTGNVVQWTENINLPPSSNLILTFFF